MSQLSPIRRVWLPWKMRARTKPRHIISWWPWPRSTTPSTQWSQPAFLPVIWQLLPEELEPSESEIRLAKLAIANGLTLEGFRDPAFVWAVRLEIAQENRNSEMGPIVPCNASPLSKGQRRWRQQKIEGRAPGDSSWEKQQVQVWPKPDEV